MIDGDADLRSSLAALGPAALRELHDVLTWPEASRGALLRSLVGHDRDRRHRQGRSAAAAASTAGPRYSEASAE
jgi:hypothetical protein